MGLRADYTFIPAEARDLEDDLRAVFAELAAREGRDRHGYAGECSPPLDLVDTGAAVELLMDLAGVSAQAIRVLFRRDVLIVAGEKTPAPSAGSPTFHLIEREFGRFARAVRLTGAFDVSQARAFLVAGELRVVIPRRADRRDQTHVIPVSVNSSAPA